LIGTKINDFDLCLESFKFMSTIALHSSLNTSETVRDRGLVSKDHQYETAYEELNGHLTDDVT